MESPRFVLGASSVSQSVCWRWGCSMRFESTQHCGVPKVCAGSFLSLAERLLKAGLQYEV